MTIPWEGDTGLLVTRCASEIELERVEWLWPGRLALGKHTSIGGDPGGGKSNLATYVATSPLRHRSRLRPSSHRLCCARQAQLKPGL
jgi:hypothetical protein